MCSCVWGIIHLSSRRHAYFLSKITKSLQQQYLDCLVFKCLFGSLYFPLLKRRKLLVWIIKGWQDSLLLLIEFKLCWQQKRNRYLIRSMEEINLTHVGLSLPSSAQPLSCRIPVVFFSFVCNPARCCMVIGCPYWRFYAWLQCSE
jgi:hypothetical protein